MDVCKDRSAYIKDLQIYILALQRNRIFGNRKWVYECKLNLKIKRNAFLGISLKLSKFMDEQYYRV